MKTVTLTKLDEQSLKMETDGCETNDDVLTVLIEGIIAIRYNIMKGEDPSAEPEVNKMLIKEVAEHLFASSCTYQEIQ